MKTPDTESKLVRILVIDDESMILELTRSILESFGYKVTTVENGLDAIALYRERYNDFRVVLLDISMPDISGTQTLKALLEINPQAHIIMTSGDLGYNNEEFVDMGAYATLSKPFKLSDLKTVLTSAIIE